MLPVLPDPVEIMASNNRNAVMSQGTRHNKHSADIVPFPRTISTAPVNGILPPCVFLRIPYTRFDTFAVRSGIHTIQGSCILCAIRMHITGGMDFSEHFSVSGFLHQPTNCINISDHRHSPRTSAFGLCSMDLDIKLSAFRKKLGSAERLCFIPPEACGPEEGYQVRITCLGKMPVTLCRLAAPGNILPFPGRRTDHHMLSSDSVQFRNRGCIMLYSIRRAGLNPHSEILINILPALFYSMTAMGPLAPLHKKGTASEVTPEGRERINLVFIGSVLFCQVLFFTESSHALQDNLDLIYERMFLIIFMTHSIFPFRKRMEYLTVKTS